MLPCSYEIPQSPVIQIDRSQVPLIPDVNDPRLNHLLIDIAVAIVNRSGLLINKNPIRMFLFNLISQNGWNNQSFKELFLLCIAYMKLTLSTCNSTPESIFESCVDTALTLYGSELVFRYEELGAAISPRLFQASSQNCGLLSEVKKEMNNMFPVGNYNQFQPPNYPNYQGQPSILVLDPRTGQYVPLPNQQPYGFQPSGGYGNPHMHNSPPYHQQFGMGGINPNRSSSNDLRDYSVAGSRSWTDRTFDRTTTDASSLYSRFQPLDSSSNEKKPVVKQVRYDKEAEVYDEPYVPDVFTTAGMSNAEKEKPSIGETPMDRKLHEHVSGSTVAGSTITENTSRFEPIDDKVEITVLTDVGIDIDINGLIAEFRLEMIKSTEHPICRKHFFIPDVVVSKIPIHGNIRSLMESNDLTESAMAIRRWIDKLSLLDHDTAQASMVMIRELDHLVTRKVNDFLHHTLEVTFTIESFIDDYQDLPRYVLQRTGINGSNLLEKFSKNLIKAFGSQFNGETIENSECLILPDDVYVGYVPNTYSVLLLPKCRVDLLLPVSRKKFVLDPTEHKMLCQIIEEVMTEDDPYNVFGTTIDYHIMVTKEGVRYRAGKSMENYAYSVTMI